MGRGDSPRAGPLKLRVGNSRAGAGAGLLGPALGAAAAAAPGAGGPKGHKRGRWHRATARAQPSRRALATKIGRRGGPLAPPLWNRIPHRRLLRTVVPKKTPKKKSGGGGGKKKKNNETSHEGSCGPRRRLAARQSSKPVKQPLLPPFTARDPPLPVPWVGRHPPAALRWRGLPRSHGRRGEVLIRLLDSKQCATAPWPMPIWSRRPREARLERRPVAAPPIQRRPPDGARLKRLLREVFKPPAGRFPAWRHLRGRRACLQRPAANAEPQRCPARIPGPSPAATGRAAKGVIPRPAELRRLAQTLGGLCRPAGQVFPRRSSFCSAPWGGGGGGGIGRNPKRRSGWWPGQSAAVSKGNTGGSSPTDFTVARPFTTKGRASPKPAAQLQQAALQALG